MGTMLYSKGVFIKWPFEELNLTDPDRIASLHREYLKVGVDVLETNTFGANVLKMRSFGLHKKLREVNQSGARLA